MGLPGRRLLAGLGVVAAVTFGGAFASTFGGPHAAAQSEDDIESEDDIGFEDDTEFEERMADVLGGWVDFCEGDEARAEISFKETETILYTDAEDVEEEDLDRFDAEWAWSDEPLPEANREVMIGRPVARTFLTVLNDGPCPVALLPNMLQVDSLRRLGEPIEDERVSVAFPESDTFLFNDGRPVFEPYSVTSFAVTILGVEPGWEGLITLHSEELDGPQSFTPASMSFTTVERAVGAWPVIITGSFIAAYLLFSAIRLIGRRVRSPFDAVRDWSDGWLNQNVLSVLGFASAALSALLAASGQFDRLASVDLGIFIGINVLLAGFAGASALLVQIGQKVDRDAEGRLRRRPRVIFFWLAMVAALVSAIGVLVTIGLLVWSMTFLNEATPWLVTVILTGAAIATVVYAVQVTVFQTMKDDQEEGRTRAESGSEGDGNDGRSGAADGGTAEAGPDEKGVAEPIGAQS